MINSKEESWVTQISYACPLALGYKVTIVEYTLDPSSNSADAHSRVLATFATDSRTTLYQSVIQGKGTDQIDWSADATAKAIAKKLATTMSYSVSGAYVTSNNTVTTFEILDFSPYYPLTSVKSLDDITELTVGIGENIYVDKIYLEGYNANGGVYYGFRQSEGEWVLVDSSGMEIGQGDDSTSARLITDEVTGKVYLQGQCAGEIYLKYKIKDNIYSSSVAPNTFATNEGIDTEIIKVKTVQTVSVGTPEYMEQTDNYIIESTPDDLMKDLRTVDVLKIFAEEGFYGCGIVEYVVYMSETEAQNHINGQLLTQELIDEGNLGNEFYVMANINNKYSEYVKVVLKEESGVSVTYGEKQYYSESESDKGILIEESVMDPASPVTPVDCNNLHTGGTATCIEKAICEECGESYGEFASHKDENKDGKCDICGIVFSNNADASNGSDRSAASSSSQNGNSPNTEDSAHFMAWFWLLFGSMTVFAGLVFGKKKRDRIN